MGAAWAAARAVQAAAGARGHTGTPARAAAHRRSLLTGAATGAPWCAQRLRSALGRLLPTAVASDHGRRANAVAPPAAGAMDEDDISDDLLANLDDICAQHQAKAVRARRGRARRAAAARKQQAVRGAQPPEDAMSVRPL